MLILVVFNFPVPDTVMTLVEPLASANAFVAMLLIGMMFEFRTRADQYRTMFSVIGLRILFGAICSTLLYFCLPFPLEVRQVLAVVTFAPVSSLAPDLYRALSKRRRALEPDLSISVLFSLAIMTGLVLLMKN